MILESYRFFKKSYGVIMSSAWVKEELGESVFKDKRLNDRFLSICENMASSLGSTIPDICEDWAQAKATYRFLSNDRVTEAEILAGHFSSTKKRIDASSGPILILHDTTEFTYKRKGEHDLGLVHRTKLKGRAGVVEYTLRGILMHASLAVTPEGLPLGLSSIKFWTRDKFKGTNALKRKINPTRVPIEEKESFRWIQNLRDSSVLMENPGRFIHVGDRENDIYEFFCEAGDIGTNFIVRACVDRLAGESTISEIIASEAPAFTRKITLTDQNGKEVSTQIEVKFKAIEIHPPIGKEKRYSSLDLMFINAREVDPPDDRDPINWNLVTNISSRANEEVWTMINWYKRRWSIETYFKVLKTICRAEDSKLRASDRLARLIAILSVMSWRIHWLTMLAREEDKISLKIAFNPLEISILEKMVPEKKSRVKNSTVQFYLQKIARLGGYLARASDPPPGPLVIWRGLIKLNEFQRLALSGFETF